jgi:hypothetical protein
MVGRPAYPLIQDIHVNELDVTSYDIVQKQHGQVKNVSLEDVKSCIENYPRTYKQAQICQILYITEDAKFVKCRIYIKSTRSAVDVVYTYEMACKMEKQETFSIWLEKRVAFCFSMDNKMRMVKLIDVNGEKEDLFSIPLSDCQNLLTVHPIGSSGDPPVFITNELPRLQPCPTFSRKLRIQSKRCSGFSFPRGTPKKLKYKSRRT